MQFLERSIAQFLGYASGQGRTDIMTTIINCDDRSDDNLNAAPLSKVKSDKQRHVILPVDVNEKEEKPLSNNLTDEFKFSEGCGKNDSQFFEMVQKFASMSNGHLRHFAIAKCRIALLHL